MSPGRSPREAEILGLGPGVTPCANPAPGFSLKLLKQSGYEKAPFSLAAHRPDRHGPGGFGGTEPPPGHGIETLSLKTMA